jgi:protein SCO1/2
MPRLLVALALLLAVAALVAGCGDSTDSAAESTRTAATTTTADEHTDDHTESTSTDGASSDILFPPTEAPALGLKDHLGNEVTTEQFRGKVMFVTFVYASCPDICPLIVSNLRRTLDKLGPRAKDVQVVAVSVDPKGDTAPVITSYLKNQRMTGRMVWLVGSRDELEAAWSRWGIATRIPRDNPDLVEHAAPIYGVNKKGVI